ncbi:MAG: hypothetical protein HY000_32400 [Planctomycetes bacterium]|nr:hypothetical protein [Planctomycetota bacterium]
MPAEERHPANVPPTLEIEVLDPNADPRGNPTVELQRCPDGQLQVDIPPVVLVHKYYYTGDRSFQAQLLPGGPSVVVVHHPRTGERCYINVQMMPGAPRVTYTAHGIEYDFGRHGISITFGLLGKPKVEYRSGIPLPTRVAGGAKAIYTETCELIEETGVHEHCTDCAEAAKNALHSTCGSIHKLSDMATSPIKQIVNRTPLSGIFRRAPEEHAQVMRDRRVQRATESLRAAEASIPTVR